MAKATKKQRNFVKKVGGVKGMLDKGHKGKLKMKKRRSADDKENTEDKIAQHIKKMKSNKMAELAEQKREEEDFAGKSNLGDLDLESFLKNVTNDDEDDGNDGNESEEEDDVVEKEGSADDDSSSDDDSDDEEDGMDSDDDEDIEAAEERMKAELSKLAESDPDFHQYLQENEASLLDFQGVDAPEANADGSDIEEDGDDDEAMEDQGDDNDVERKSKIVVDAKLLKSYEHGAFHSHGIKALKRIISAYVAACHMADTNDDNENATAASRSYQIESSTVFDKLMVTCLAKCHEEFHYHLLGEGATVQKKDGGSDDDDDDDEEMDEEKNVDKPINPRQFEKSRRWEVLKLPIQSFFKATLHIISEAKEAKLLRFILKSLSHYVPYLSAYPRLAKAVLKNLTNLWSTTSDSTDDYQAVRLNAFLRIRQLALTQPFPFIENCLKATYLAYAKSAKFANAATVSSLLPTLTFMGNCVVELYCLDYASSYQHAFVYIRQLALHLRTALQKKTPEAFRVVYCWQYMHCIKLWTAVLAATSSQSGSDSDDETALMKSLIYPLVEIIFGVARLIPTTRHLPLRFHCVRNLQQLAAASETFIPTTSILLEVFDLKEVTMTPKRNQNRGTDVRGIRLPLILKLPKTDSLRTAEQLDACFGELFLLLNREVDLYRYSAGFPEFTIRICQRLRKFAKETKNGKFRSYAKGCIELCTKHSTAASLARTDLEEAPKDIKRLEVLKPNNIPTMGDRYEMTTAKEKRLEAAAQPAISQAAKDKVNKAKEAKEQEEKRQAAIAAKKLNKKNKQKKAQDDKQFNEEDLKNEETLNAEVDEVQEGIDWSESEEESGSESE